MIPTVKMSQTLLEFGKVLIDQLPDDYSQTEVETVLSLIITIWNAVVIDSDNKNKALEAEILQSFKNGPIEFELIVKRLIKRKKTKFSKDPRLVGSNWVKVDNGSFKFVCESRLNLKNI